MRFDTHRTSAYLVEKLKATGAVIRHDGGDIILLVGLLGEKVSIHLIESPIPLYEIKSILKDNAKDGIHTLFVFWCDMLLPREGEWYEPDDWMAAMLALHGQKIYAYELYGSEVFIFPVHFEGGGRVRRVRYGDTIEAAFLECGAIHTIRLDFMGNWRVASFTVRPPNEYWQQHTENTTDRSRPVSPTRQAAYCAVLNVKPSDDMATIKKAYRLLARKYHPDLNDAPDATERMQQINEAYTWIMRQLDDEVS